MNTRSIAASLAVLGVLTVTGCSSRTRVELESASAPAVPPAGGQSDADVVDARVIDIDNQSIQSTTTQAATTTTTTTSIDPTAPTSTAAPNVAVDQATTQLCRNEKRILKTAVEDYRADQGMSPTSEGDLIAFAYVRTASTLYDVRVDGSVVAQGDTCAGVR